MPLTLGARLLKYKDGGSKSLHMSVIGPSRPRCTAFWTPTRPWGPRCQNTSVMWRQRLRTPTGSAFINSC
eukprot:8712383-Pyramimonas_sp.AAC.1